MLDIILKYKLWYPLRVLRLLYYNFVRITRASGKAFLILARHSLIDADKTARIELRSSVIFGWCNMRCSSRLETALCMAENSKIIFGGGGGKNKGQVQGTYGS